MATYLKLSDQKRKRAHGSNSSRKCVSPKLNVPAGMPALNLGAARCYYGVQLSALGRAAPMR